MSANSMGRGRWFAVADDVSEISFVVGGARKRATTTTMKTTTMA